MFGFCGRGDLSLDTHLGECEREIEQVREEKVVRLEGRRVFS